MPINLLADEAPQVPQITKGINLLADEVPPANESLLGKVGDVAGKFNSAVQTSGLPALAGGFLQGSGDLATSIANIPLQAIGKAIGKDVRIPHPDLGKYVDNSLPSKIAFGGGEIAPMLLGGGELANVIGKAGGMTEKLSSIPKIGGLIARPTEGALAGAAVGEDKEGNRGLAAELGAAGNSILSMAKHGKSLLPENLANKILSAKNAAQDKYSSIYNGLFGEAEKRGLNNTPMRKPNIDVDLIKDNSEKKYHQALMNFNDNPTLENAHWAQSDLGKYIRYLDGVKRTNPLTSPQLKAYQEAIDAQKKLRGSMFTSLVKNSSQDLASKYGEATKGYAKDVVPYLNSKPISAMENNDIDAKTFINRLIKNTKFRKSMDSVHPEIAQHQMIKKLLSYVPLKTLIAGAGVAAGYNEFRDSDN